MARCRSDEQGGWFAASASFPASCDSRAVAAPTNQSHNTTRPYTQRLAPLIMATTYPALHHDFLSLQPCTTLLRTPVERRRPALWSRSALLFLFAANWRWLAAPMLANTFAAVRAQRPRFTKTHVAHTLE